MFHLFWHNSVPVIKITKKDDSRRKTPTGLEFYETIRFKTRISQEWFLNFNWHRNSHPQEWEDSELKSETVTILRHYIITCIVAITTVCLKWKAMPRTMVWILIRLLRQMCNFFSIYKTRRLFGERHVRLSFGKIYHDRRNFT